MDANSQSNTNDILDLIIVGGGINGAGIAADASGRGLKLALYEANDFASATSSASSKLIHGGLRYLEHYEFRLVSEALAEREILLKKAPHITKPMRFRLPHRPFLRPSWMIRAGLFLYDHLGKRTSLASSRSIDFSHSSLLQPQINQGFEYSDCWVDDARLTLLNILQAKENGAKVQNYTQVVFAKREGNIWRVQLLDKRTNQTFEKKAKALINATGPWVKDFITEKMNISSQYGVRLIKGSHIVVPKIHNDPQAYILQNNDKRIVFVIPYLEDFSLIGTTDLEFKGDPSKVEINTDEINYLLDIVNQHFINQTTAQDIIWHYSGVRPLCDDESDSPQAITRDYTLAFEHPENQAPLLNVFGGKLTTYRKLAETALSYFKEYFPQMSSPWTSKSLLPGAENYQYEASLLMLLKDYPWLDERTCKRYLNQFGSRTFDLLKNITQEEQMGAKFSSGVYQIEIDYLCHQEMANTAEDILWRRTKLGLFISQQTCEDISTYLKVKN